MKIVLYGNGGSGNHGCEAIVRGTFELLQESFLIASEAVEEDKKYGLEKLGDIYEAKTSKGNMLSSIVLFMLIFIYGQMVAQSIAQEKTSKVMELLLTSVRPLAIIIGKILAMGSLALIQFMMIIASGVLGIAVSTPLSSSIIGSSEETGAVTSQLMNEVGNALGGFSPVVKL